jgi:Cu(I)/Ag(I) efflux system membrane fusion protein
VEPEKVADSLAALSDTQKEAIAGFVKTADALAAALAADDLTAFNQAADPAMGQAGKLAESLRSREGVSEALDALEKERHPQKFEDIQAARVAFHKFSVAATAVLEPLRMTDGAPAFDVWECFMVDQAIPNAAKNGRWVQVAGRTGENPFFGKQMLNCAKEIKRSPSQP